MVPEALSLQWHLPGLCTSWAWQPWLRGWSTEESFSGLSFGVGALCSCPWLKIIPKHDTRTRKPESTKATSLQAQINYVWLRSTLILHLQQYTFWDEPPQMHIKPLLLKPCSLENRDKLEITHTLRSFMKSQRLTKEPQRPECSG